MSNEEIVFYKECIEPIPSLVEDTPSLAEGLPRLVLGTSSPHSTLELPTDKGESTGSLSGHGLPVGVSTGPYMTQVLPTLVARLSLASMASTQCRTTPRPIYSTMRKLFSGKTNSYWAIGVNITAPVPQLIVVQPVLWVINTLHDPSTFGRPSPVPSKQAPTEIGELTIAIANYICPTMWYSPYDCSTRCYIIIYGLYTLFSHCSLFYHSSVDHSWPIPSTHPHNIHSPVWYLP